MENSDKQLLERIKGNDDSAFKELFEAYFKIMVVFAQKFVSDTDLAQELVQDVFVTFFEKKNHIKADISLKSFLFKSTQNKCLDYLKTQKTRESHHQFFDGNSAANPVEEFMAEAELLSQINEVVAQLSPQCQKIFLLSRTKGKSNQEIANDLQLSKRTVETQISKALKYLRKHLQHYLYTLLLFFLKFF